MKKKLTALLVLPAVLLISATAFGAGVRVARQAGNLQVNFMIDKAPAAGRNLARVQLTDNSGRAVTDALVRVYWMMPPMGSMARMEGYADAARSGNEYHAVMNLETAGTWHVMVKVKRAGRLLPPARFDINAR
ncbi:MAG: FixH family protein [Actinomycetota bacterium]|nr:FixH family protein [Actinomycetota bacterium]